MSARIILLEDDESLKRVLSRALASAGYQVRATASAQTALSWIADGQADLLLADVLLNGTNFFDQLGQVHRLQPELPVIIMSAQTTASTAISAEKGGVFDYLPKPFDLDVMTDTVAAALGKTPKTIEPFAKKEPTGLVGRSDAIQAMFKALARAATSRAHVLISGETGVGKKQAAEALFQTLNVAMDDVLMLTSSHSADAIFKSTGSGQPVLWLRIDDWDVVQQKAGRDALDAGQARVIATYTVSSETSLNSTLLSRLGESLISVPPLRDRVEDIPLLSQAFLREIADRDAKSPVSLAPEALKQIEQSVWPTNLTGLKSALSRLSLSVRGKKAKAEDIIRVLKPVSSGYNDMSHSVIDPLAKLALSKPDSRQFAVDKLDRCLIEMAMKQMDGNRTKAAELLGLNRNTLARRITELNLDL